MKTTFEEIKKNHPCDWSWKKLISYYNPSDLKEEVSIKQIIKSNGIRDTVWTLRALRAVKDRKKVMLFCADVAESVLPIFTDRFPDNDSVNECIQGVRDFCKGKISVNELERKSSACSIRGIYGAAAYAIVAAKAAARGNAEDTAKESVCAVDEDAMACNTIYAMGDGAEKWKEIEQLLLKYC